MESNFGYEHRLGVNGLGRMGKLTLWYHLLNRQFSGMVINVGREVGKRLEDIIQIVETDSTYGSLHNFLYGHSGKRCEITITDREKGEFQIDGFSVKVLREARNPRYINWAKEGICLVVDCTGAFLDPTIPPDHSKGSIRGHLEAGAEKVIASAPFKIKDSTRKLPEDSALFVYGINHIKYHPGKHHLISAASCTTTGLAHMMKPLVESEETARILTASMSTVHAATSSQSILDAVPKAGAKDLRKNRAVLNNIILTSTGAARALEKILPEIQKVGFMADSVRIPTNTVSLISLNITFHTRLNEMGDPIINQTYINNIYKTAAEGSQKGMLAFSEKQNVSSDLIGYEAAIVIEGHETHTRTGFVRLSSEMLKEFGVSGATDIQLPVTHAKIFGWYDNEYGSYVVSLGKLTTYIDNKMR